MTTETSLTADQEAAERAAEEFLPPAPDPGSGPVALLRGLLAILALAGPIIWILDVPRLVFGFVLYTEQILCFELAVVLPLLFLTFGVDGKRMERPGLLDWFFAALAFGSAGYLTLFYGTLVNELVFLPVEGIVVATILVIAAIEAVRRATGLTLALVVVGLIALSFWGYLLPEPYNSREISPARLAVYLGIDTNAMLGLSLQTGVLVIVPFILLGKLLSVGGGSEFFGSLALSAMGRFRGGPGKIAVVGSALFGTISGSAVANVAGTGVVTIPLMKRAGFPGHVAGGIESVAATGGQLMPPVIGAAGFLMAEFLVLPYGTVMLAALIPIMLYYAAIFILVDLFAAKKGLKGVPRKEIPSAWPEFRQGWHFLLPFILFLFLMFQFDMQPEVAILIATAVLLCTIYAFGYHGKRPSLKQLWGAVYDAGESCVEIVVVCAAADLVIGALNLSGISFTLANQLLTLAGGDVFILLIFAAIASLILGLGLPTVSVYILLATLIAPAIISTGVEPIAAHLFVLYLGLMSMVTPPVAVASFAAATIARASPWATSWSAMWFGWTAYIVPFVFVFAPAMLLIFDPWSGIGIGLTTLAGIYLISISSMGFARVQVGPVERVVCFIIGAGLFVPAAYIPGGLAGVIALIAAGAAILGKLFFYDHKRAVPNALPG